MINLLPPDKAIQIRYGRSNNMLRGWLLGGVGAIGVLMLIIIGGVIYLEQQSDVLQKSIASDKQQLASGNIGQVETDVKTISSDVKLINQVLGREISFSELMQQIGKVMPSGTVLSSLTLTNISAGMDVTANALDYPSAAQIAVNLSDTTNDLFTKVDIVNISCGQKNTSSPYPCSATFRALFSKSAANRFLVVANKRTAP